MRSSLIGLIIGFATIAFADATPPTPSDLSRWREIDPPPLESVAARCARWSNREWNVTAPGGKPAIDEHPPAGVRNACSGGRGGQVFPVDGGWLGTEAHGEWGGSLCWKPTADGPSQPLYDGDPVIGVANTPKEHLALAGMDHMGTHTGEILAVEKIGGSWRAKIVTRLQNTPYAFLVEPSGALLVVTHEGIERVVDHRATVVHRGRWSGLYPSSMARAADGTIYIGMRYAVARLKPEGDHYVERWLVLGSCEGVKCDPREFDESAPVCRCDKGEFRCGSK
jgi:hypothetical protein